MPYNGSGIFILAQAPFVPATPISSSAMNADLGDIANGLSDVVTRDGQGAMDGNPVTPLQVATKQYVDSSIGTVFDAQSYNGMQINGSMEVSQERGTTPANSSGQYICDGWKQFYSGTVVIAGQSASVAGTGLYPGYNNVIAVSVTTAQASLAAGDFAIIAQPLEGYRVSRLAWGTASAHSITIAFWSNHHRAGLYSGSVRNSAFNRSYSFAYTHNISDVAQYNSVTIPGDTTGTWATDNTTGILLTFSLGSGTTFTAPSANTWSAGNYQAAPGQINGVAALTDIFRITGVVVIPGTLVLTASQSPLIMRPYDEELQLCRRYYYKRSIDILGSAVGAGASLGPWFAHPVQMRASPTVTSSGGTPFNVNAEVIDLITIDGYRHYLTSTAAGDTALTGGVDVADARL